MRNTILIAGLFVLMSSIASAQDMKKIDVQILGQATGFLHATGESDRAVMYAAPELQVQYNFNRFLSAGIVYSRSVMAWSEIFISDANEVPADQVSSEFQS